MRVRDLAVEMFELARRLELIREDAPPGAEEQWKAAVEAMLRKHDVRMPPKKGDRP